MGEVMLRCEKCKQIVDEDPRCYREGCDGKLEIVAEDKTANVVFCKKCRRSCLIDDYKVQCPFCGSSAIFFITADLAKKERERAAS